MEYSEYLPSGPLKNYINCFWIIESEKPMFESQWDRTLPDGSLEIVFHLKDAMLRKSLTGQPEKESESILIGQVTKPYLFRSTGEVSMLGVRFFPHSAHHFFDIAVNEVNDSAPDLELLWNKQYRSLRNRIKEAVNIHQTVSMLESFFLKKIKSLKVTARDRYLSYACRTILQGKGNIPINEISGDIGISNRYLERIFQHKTGISPKLFSRVIRFQHTLKYISAEYSLTEVALNNGYFDQPHFIRDFKDFTGLAPKDFIHEQHPLTENFITPDNSSYLYNSP